jgi:hypothetical protein
MKYRKSDKGYQKRGSKTNLTVGAFGTPKIISQNLKVLRKSWRTKENSNSCGVAN